MDFSVLDEIRREEETKDDKEKNPMLLSKMNFVNLWKKAISDNDRNAIITMLNHCILKIMCFPPKGKQYTVIATSNIGLVETVLSSKQEFDKILREKKTNQFKKYIDPIIVNNKFDKDKIRTFNLLEGREWVIDINKYQIIDGITIPSKELQQKISSDDTLSFVTIVRRIENKE